MIDVIPMILTGIFLVHVISHDFVA